MHIFKSVTWDQYDIVIRPSDGDLVLGVISFPFITGLSEDKRHLTLKK